MQMTETVMLPTSCQDLREIPASHLISELKLDGLRCLFLNGQLINRYGKNITQDFPEIQINFNGILDGEICIFKSGSELETDFNALQNHKNNNLKAFFVAFDVLEYDSRSLVNQPLKDRRTYLKHAKGDQLKTILDLPIPSWQEVQRLKLEGLIFKNPESHYEFKRSKNWLKLKAFKEISGQIKAIAESKSENGFTIEFKPDNLDIIQRIAVQNPNFRQLISDSLRAGIQPRGAVQYFEITKEGHLRMPTFKELL